jgi:4-phospho-D-threonate 3-dehydrogenase / 4-phospho-D-erythronate 3-dehydrogenase
LNQESNKTILALTMGDPAGIGPEILAKQNWNQITSKAIPIIFGNREILNEAFLAYGDQNLIKLDDFNNNSLKNDTVFVYESDNFNLNNLKKGMPSKLSGESSLNAISTATDTCINKNVHAMVTAPVSKEAIEMTGIDFHGHTEWISNRCGDYDEMMMMSSHDLNVGYVTTHIPLNQLHEKITCELVLRRIESTHRFLLDSKQNPKIAVCGLNPHAGENGILGDEEIQAIIPAINRAKELGIQCSGPYPADTIFIESQRKKYGAILAMYHDQGGIPFKMLAFDTGVNHTLNLPIIRTSVDHGTAWDIAWKDKASSSSLFKAIEMAITLAESRGFNC